MTIQPDSFLSWVSNHKQFARLIAEYDNDGSDLEVELIAVLDEGEWVFHQAILYAVTILIAGQKTVLPECERVDVLGERIFDEDAKEYLSAGLRNEIEARHEQFLEGLAER